MAHTKVLCILTTLLGNKSTARRLIQALDGIEGLKPTYVLVNVEDYVNYPAPRWSRLTNSWHAQYIARKKAQPVLNDQFDLLLVNSWEYIIAFSRMAQRMPAAALMDSVPATVNAQLCRRGFGGLKRWAAHQMQDRPFGQAVRDFQYFLPMGSNCADALERHYGVDRERCFVTLVPQDLERWTPGGRSYTPPLRLLFVGNDFGRKGGDLLLRLYSEYLKDTCTLTIASNDPSIAARKLPPGSKWLQGRDHEQLLQVYRESDVFLFPTQQDYMPQVLAEALTAGVPCIASDVGDIRDLVQEGENGFLLPWDAPAEHWAERIASLNSNPAELGRLAAGARSFAEKKLGVGRFEDLIAKVIQSLRANGARK